MYVRHKYTWKRTGEVNEVVLSCSYNIIIYQVDSKQKVWCPFVRHVRAKENTIEITRATS